MDNDNLTGPQKEAAIDELRQHALIQQTALQGHLVRKRYIAGGDYGSSDALNSYSTAVNHYLADREYRSDMDKVMQRMEAQDTVNRTTDNAEDSSAVANELRARAYSKSYQAPMWFRRLQSLAFARWMLGPRHILMQMTHLLAYGVPSMAGRHGGFNTMRAVWKAMGDTGGALEGLKIGGKATADQARSMFTRDSKLEEKLARTPDVTGDMIARIPETNRRDAMMQLQDTGQLSSGFGDDFYGSTGYAKVDAMERQISSALDAQNRLAHGLAAYDLEFKKTGDHKQAIDYARRQVEGLLGVHTPEGVPTALRNPLMRGFMQFKQLPARLIYGLVRNVYKAFKDESADVRKEAFRSLAYQVGVATSAAGVYGLPVGLLKPLGLLGSALNVTPSPSQIDDKIRTGLADIMGPTAANVFMDGLPAAYSHAPVLTSMFSRDLDVAFGEPRHGDFTNYLLDTVGGAPVAIAGDALTGIYNATHGDWNGAVNNLPAPRLISDIWKAAQLGESGYKTTKGVQLTPESYEDAAWRALGFTTQGIQRAQEGHALAQQAVKDQQQLKGAKGQALKRGKMTLGVQETPKNRALLQRYREVYQ